VKEKLMMVVAENSRGSSSLPLGSELGKLLGILLGDANVLKTSMKFNGSPVLF